jgi:coenzyme F420-reducing hydrogenase beta subunit
MNINETTLKQDKCINCGICKIVCPKKAITLNLNKYNEKIPSINNDLCNNCGVCSHFCPNSEDNLKEEISKVSQSSNPQTFGLENSSYYVAWSNDEEQRLKCCSGGATTELITYLFNNNKIDGVIHVERIWAKRNQLHYKACLSETLEDIKNNVSSAYQAIDFSEILAKLEKNKTYFLTGTPCVIRGIKKLQKEHKDFKEIKILTCALVCSHNTNAQVIDFLTEINELCDNDLWKVNIRHKDNTIIDANNFKNHIYTKEKDLLNKNRFESGWTHIWRNYYFAMGACLKCCDFWGYSADISIKDAWGEWAKDAKGKSIVIIRNNDLEKEFLNSNITVEKLDFETMKDHQNTTSSYKQKDAFVKNYKSILSKRNRKNGLFKYSIISKSTKFLYKNFGYKFTKTIMPVIEWLAIRGEKL